MLWCIVENYGSNGKLVTEVNLKRGWAFFCNDPEGNYCDLEGVRTVRHSGQDFEGSSPRIILEPLWQPAELERKIIEFMATWMMPSVLWSNSFWKNHFV